MSVLDVFRLKPDGSFVWVGSGDSLKKAGEIIESCTAAASEEFVIYDAQTTERITLRTDRYSMRWIWRVTLGPHPAEPLLGV